MNGRKMRKRREWKEREECVCEDVKRRRKEI